MLGMTAVRLLPAWRLMALAMSISSAISSSITGLYLGSVLAFAHATMALNIRTLFILILGRYSWMMLSPMNSGLPKYAWRSKNLLCSPVESPSKFSRVTTVPDMRLHISM